MPTFNLPVNDQIEQRLSELLDPTFGLARFQRLGASATPTADTFLARTAALGGSPLQAQEQMQQAQQQVNAQVFNSFQGFQDNLLGAQQGLLGLLSQNQGLSQQLRLRDRLDRRAGRRSLLSSLIGTLGGIGITAATGGFGGLGLGAQTAASAGAGGLGFQGARLPLPRGLQQPQVPPFLDPLGSGHNPFNL